MKTAVAVFLLLTACRQGAGLDDACVFDADCPDDFACEASECVPTCLDDSECGAAQVCGPGINTVSRICRAPNTSGGDGFDTATNNTPPRTELSALVIESTTEEACETSEPGPDIFGVALEDASGRALAWGQVEFAAVATSGNDYANSSVLDGAPPAIDSVVACPDTLDSHAVSLGCGGAYVVVSFTDLAGETIGFARGTGQQIRVHEWGSQCELDEVEETYSARLCTNADAAWSGDISSCSVPIVQGTGEQVGAI